MLDPDRLDQLLEQFSGKTVALIGDLFLDRYMEIDQEIQENSIETGLPVHHVTRIRNSPGALGTVINNLAALGARRLVPVTIIGHDGHGDDLVRSLGTLPVDLDHIVRSPTRMTPTYAKPMRQNADGQWQELNRLDMFSRSPLDEESSRLMLEHLQQLLQQADGLIVLDQMNDPELGVINAATRQVLHQLIRDEATITLVDSRTHLHAFSCGILKGNTVEIVRAWEALSGEQEEAPDAVVKLAGQSGHVVYCTRGEQGAMIGHPDGRCEPVAGFPVEGPVDIVGAGDSATSGFFLSLLSGATPAEAAEVGNLVASITVRQLGTTGTATPSQVRARLLESISRE